MCHAFHILSDRNGTIYTYCKHDTPTSYISTDVKSGLLSLGKTFSRYIFLYGDEFTVHLLFSLKHTATRSGLTQHGSHNSLQRNPFSIKLTMCSLTSFFNITGSFQKKPDNQNYFKNGVLLSLFFKVSQRFLYKTLSFHLKLQNTNIEIRCLATSISLFFMSLETGTNYRYSILPKVCRHFSNHTHM